MNPAITEILAKLLAANKARQSAYARHLGETLLAIDPGHSLALLFVADHLIIQSQYEKASQIFDRLETMTLPEKQRYRLLVLRGELLEKRGCYADALSEFVKAHELRPAFSSPLIYAGGCAFHNGDLEQALDFARRASACKEGCIDEALYNQGGFLAALKRYEEARTCYEQSLAIDPEDRHAQKRLADLDLVLADIARGPSDDGLPELYNRIYAADKAGQVAYVRHVAAAYLRLTPGNAMTFLRYASALKTYSQFEEAMRALDAAAKMIPAEWRHLIHSFRGDVHESHGDLDAAIAEWEKADELDTRGGAHHVNCQAWAAFRQGKVEEAIERLRQTLTRPGIDEKETLDDLGWFLLCLQRYDESQQCYEQFLTLDPENVNAKKKLLQIELILAK